MLLMYAKLKKEKKGESHTESTGRLELGQWACYRGRVKPLEHCHLGSWLIEDKRGRKGHPVCQLHTGSFYRRFREDQNTMTMALLFLVSLFRAT
jgi:hypothetical protein